MPAKSKSQQRLMGMVHAYQKGELKIDDIDKELEDKIKSMAKKMKPKDVKDFTKTKHKNLPEKVEKLSNFYEFALLEYKDLNGEFDMLQFTQTINNETNPDIITDLLFILHTRKEYQEKIEQYYKDNKNMLKFPEEVSKERDLRTINLLDGFLNKRLKDIKDGNIKPKEKKKKEQKLKRLIGYNRSNKKPIEVPKGVDLKQAYKTSSGLGFKFKHESFLINFETFNETKKKNIEKELMIHQSKKVEQDD